MCRLELLVWASDLSTAVCWWRCVVLPRDRLKLELAAVCIRRFTISTLLPASVMSGTRRLVFWPEYNHSINTVCTWFNNLSFHFMVFHSSDANFCNLESTSSLWNYLKTTSKKKQKKTNTPENEVLTQKPIVVSFMKATQYADLVTAKALNREIQLRTTIPFCKALRVTSSRMHNCLPMRLKLCTKCSVYVTTQYSTPTFSFMSKLCNYFN